MNIVLASLFSFIVVCPACGVNISVMQRLISDKFNGYKRSLRPIRNQNNSVEIRVYFELGSIHEVDEVLEKFSVTGLLYIYWFDEFIRWKPEEYGGIDMITIPSEDVWYPHLAIANPFDKVNMIKNEWLPVRYFSNGEALYAPVDIMPTKCSMDITFYPFDTQSCEIHIANFGYLPTEVRLLPGRGDILKRHFTTHGQWDLVKSSVSHENLEVLSLVNFHFHIKRKYTFFIVNVIVPILFMSFLNIMVFQLPTESGERVSYSITVLLAIAVFLTMVGENLPRVSSPMPIICYYLMSVLSLSVLTCLLVIFSVKLYFKEEDDTVPLWLRTIYGIFHCQNHQAKSVRPPSPVAAKQQSILLLKDGRSRPRKSSLYDKDSSKQHKISSERETTAFKISKGMELENLEKSPGIRRLDSGPSDCDAIVDSGSRDEVEITWKMISVFFDKVFFFITLITLLILTLLFLISMIKNIDILPK